MLTLATFIIAYYLRIFRNGKFLGRSVSLPPDLMPLHLLTYEHVILITWLMAAVTLTSLQPPALVRAA